MKEKARVTNRQYASDNTFFNGHCVALAEKLEVSPEIIATARQASKFRRGKGRVWAHVQKG